MKHNSRTKWKIFLALMLLFWTIQLTEVQAAETENDHELSYPGAPDSDAVTTYRRFWDAFKNYEQKKNSTSGDEYKKATTGVESTYANVDKEFTAKRTNFLSGAITRYNESLSKAGNSTNRAFVLINLAQIYSELSFLQHSTGNSDAKKTRELALSAIESIETDFPNFRYINDALYLQATLLEANDESDKAEPIWAKLAAKSGDYYSLHANLVLGDREFEKAQPAKAAFYYNRATAILGDMPGDQRGFDEVRTHYRTAWANFKSGKVDQTFVAIKKLLAPSVISRATLQKEKILKDLGELAAHSLFQADSEKRTRNFFLGSDFDLIGPQAALSLMEEYSQLGMATKACFIGDLASTRFALASDFPDILRMKAKSEGLAGRSDARLETLEKLSMLLPDGSLWRHRNSENSAAIIHMENLAKNAAELVATSYYQQGLASGSPRKFTLAATYYRILLDDAPNSDKSSAIRLNIANAKYFSDNLEESERGYSELITGLKTPEEILMTAYYQRALVLEKLWRRDFELAVQKNREPAKDKFLISRLKQLESAVEDHANRFPAQSRSIDLLLVAASANRDQDMLDQASRFWQRALISNPSPSQRAMAVRGIIFTKIKNGSPKDVIESAADLLKADNSSLLHPALRQELLGVISSAASDESTRLSKQGLGEQAGSLLLQLVSDFPDVVNREQMWRDGAYMLAISGNWARAQASAESYKKTDYKRFAADMTYLLARAHEYQLRFGPAVRAYLDLANSSPNHPRAKVSLDRAEKLALADDNFQDAGRAAELSADLENNKSKKFIMLDSAIQYYLNGNYLKRALATAERQRNLSQGVNEKLRSELTLSKVRYHSGSRQVAIDDLDTLAKQIDRNKTALGTAYPLLAAEANMFLGEHNLTEFQRLRITGMKGKTLARIDQKSRILTEATTRLDKVINLNLPELSAKARFLVGQAALEFAEEINSLPSRAGELTTLKTQTRFNQNISHLREMAQKYHGNNLLAKQRTPAMFARSEWISKSAEALSNLNGSGQKNTGTGTLKTDQLSRASSIDLPQQWSH